MSDRIAQLAYPPRAPRFDLPRREIHRANTPDALRSFFDGWARTERQ